MNYLEKIIFIRCNELSMNEDCANANVVRIACGGKDCGNKSENDRLTDMWLWGNDYDNSIGIIKRMGMIEGVHYIGRKGGNVILSQQGIVCAIADSHHLVMGDAVKIFMKQLRVKTNERILQCMSPEALELYNTTLTELHNEKERRLEVTKERDEAITERDEVKGIIVDIEVKNNSMDIEEALRSCARYGDDFVCNCGRETLYRVFREVGVLDKSRRGMSVRLNKPYQQFSDTNEKGRFIKTRIKWSEEFFKTIHRLVNPSSYPQLYTTLTESQSKYNENVCSIQRSFKSYVQTPSNELVGIAEQQKELIQQTKIFKNKKKRARHPKH